MKRRNKMMMAAATALGFSGMAYAGQGMGSGHCGQGYGMHHGMHQGEKCVRHRDRGMYRRHGMHEGYGGMQRMMSRLDLSDAQRQQIHQIMRESRAGMQGGGMGKGRGMKGEHLNRGMDLSKFMTQERFDKEAFTKAKLEKWAEQDSLRKKRRVERLNRMADRMEKIFRVLTPEQREKLIELSKNRARGTAGE
ncbi:Spy/CpxP family protein refolding chaperone [Nitratifractor sp.]|uniref:Spy/CpxP family protein refolding chaperone n=1 Tax=Nitratifractor sp. TaxID=2268144 RepID=UPI0025CD4F4B|nr:Spy/CpxP family protein refolding chaperone [Nitratifractor sp.]